MLWQQKDRFFSRWKERFFILTQVLLNINDDFDKLLKIFQDYLHCFKKESSRITEMGGFIFKVSPDFHPFLKTHSCLQCQLSFYLCLKHILVCSAATFYSVSFSKPNPVWFGKGKPQKCVGFSKPITVWFRNKTLPKALRTQALTALTSNLGLVGLVRWVWLGRFG